MSRVQSTSQYVPLTQLQVPKRADDPNMGGQLQVYGSPSLKTEALKKQLSLTVPPQKAADDWQPLQLSVGDHRQSLKINQNEFRGEAWALYLSDDNNDGKVDQATLMAKDLSTAILGEWRMPDNARSPQEKAQPSMMIQYDDVIPGGTVSPDSSGQPLALLSPPEQPLNLQQALQATRDLTHQVQLLPVEGAPNQYRMAFPLENGATGTGKTPAFPILDPDVLAGRKPIEVYRTPRGNMFIDLQPGKEAVPTDPKSNVPVDEIGLEYEEDPKRIRFEWRNQGQIVRLPEYSKPFDVFTHRELLADPSGKVLQTRTSEPIVNGLMENNVPEEKESLLRQQLINQAKLSSPD